MPFCLLYSYVRFSRITIDDVYTDDGKALLNIIDGK